MAANDLAVSRRRIDEDAVTLSAQGHAFHLSEVDVAAPSPDKVLIVTVEDATARTARGILASDSQFEPRAEALALPSLAEYLQHVAYPLVVIDIEPHPIEALERLHGLVDSFPQTRFIALVAEANVDVIRKAMQVGVRHVQCKRDMASELLGVARELVRGATAAPKRLGAAITVLSASGGCGATTVAVNLAHELQLAAAEEVLIVDLDYSYGTVATYLELQGRYGVAAVLAHRGVADMQLIRTTAVRHSPKLHALLSPASLGRPDAAPLRAPALLRALDACREGYRFTVLDAPRVSNEVAAALCTPSCLVAVVMQPMVKDVRVAKIMIDELVNRGIPSERIRPVLNRFRKRGQLVTVDEIQKALGGFTLLRLSNDYAGAAKGVNYGKPLAEVAARSPLRRDLAQFASETIAQVNSAGAMVVDDE